MTFGSLYSGLGAFDHGLIQAGWTCTWTAERDPALRALLERRGDQLWTRHFTDAGSVCGLGTNVDLVYAELPTADWRYAAPVIETALGRGRALVLEGSPSTWSETTKGRVFCQIADGGPTWRRTARVMRYVTGDASGRSYARKRVVVVASPVFDPAALLDAVGVTDAQAPQDAPSPADGLPVVESATASIDDLLHARGLPPDWTDGLSEPQARLALAESSSPAVGLVFGRALAAALRA